MASSSAATDGRPCTAGLHGRVPRIPCCTLPNVNSTVKKAAIKAFVESAIE